MNTYFKIKSQLDHFSVDIEYEFESGVLVIQGESGAGKTTLLKYISGLKNPEVGKIAFGEQIVFTWIGAVISACVVSLPLMYQNAKSAFISIDPIYEKAAETLGSSEWKIFRTVTLPLAWPGIISGVILSFARAIGEFGATLMIAGNIPGKTQTMPTAIYFAVESGNTDMANSLVLIMVIFSFSVIFVLNMWLKRKNYIGKQG